MIRYARLFISKYVGIVQIVRSGKTTIDILRRIHIFIYQISVNGFQEFINRFSTTVSNRKDTGYYISCVYNTSEQQSLI
jgi:hypothetical protein